MNTLVEAGLNTSETLDLPEFEHLAPDTSEALTQNTTDAPDRLVLVSAIDDHDYHALPAVRAKAALTDDGVLYLTEDARSDMLVRSYIASLDRRKALSEGKIVPYHTVYEVPYSEIQRLYTAAADPTATGLAGLRRTAEES